MCCPSDTTSQPTKRFSSLQHRYSVISGCLALDRDKLIGAKGTVTEVVEGAEELLFFKADDEALDGFGPDKAWAVIDFELDKLED